jgi:hypothetical protein
VDDWPDLWWLYIMLGFLCFASFQAWQDQYTANAGRELDIQTKRVSIVNKNEELKNQAVRIEREFEKVHEAASRRVMRRIMAT